MTTRPPFDLDDLLASPGGPYHWARVARLLASKWFADVLPRLGMPEGVDVDQLRVRLRRLAERLDQATCDRPQGEDAVVAFAEHVEVIEAALTEIADAHGEGVAVWVDAVCRRDDEGGSFAWDGIFWRLATNAYAASPPPLDDKVLDDVVTVFWSSGVWPPPGERTTAPRRRFARGASRRARNDGLVELAIDLLTMAEVDEIFRLLRRSLSDRDQRAFLSWANDRADELGVVLEGRPTLAALGREL